MAVLNDETIRSALAELGSCLPLERRVEILIVGGAAGVLTGLLPAAWTTADVDMIHCREAKDRDDVLQAAVAVGRRLSLPPSWLSEDVGLFRWTLPESWESRRIPVGIFGPLHVYAASRVDLIAMKFVAHREGDLEHLSLMKVTTDELSFVREYLDMLAERCPNEMGRIEMARQYVEAWEKMS